MLCFINRFIYQTEVGGKWLPEVFQKKENDYLNILLKKFVIAFSQRIVNAYVELSKSNLDDRALNKTDWAFYWNAWIIQYTIAGWYKEFPRFKKIPAIQ